MMMFELAPGRALAQGGSTLGAADTLVARDVDDLAAHPVGDLPERALLVLGRLPIQRTDADVQSGAAHGDSQHEANASYRRWSRLYENQMVCVRKIEWLQAIDLARPRSCKRAWVFCTSC